MVVLVGALLGSWQQIIALLGSRTILAAAIFTVITVLAGAILATGSLETRTTMALIAPLRNSGPVFAAIGIAFNNSPAILGAVAAILVIQLVICVPVAAYLAKTRQAGPEPAVVKAPQHGASDTPQMVDAAT